MKRLNQAILVIFITFLVIGGRRIQYFLHELDFIAGKPVPAAETLNKPHIRAEYDEYGRLLIKATVDEHGRILSRENYSYIDTNSTIRQKDYYKEDDFLADRTIFGREEKSLAYIEWVFGVDSVKKWDDRFTTSKINYFEKPDNYQFFDVDAFEYGGMELDYDSLGRVIRDEWFRRPDNKSMHKYLYRYYDDSEITHIFEYDSNGVLIMDVKLSPDGTEALFWFSDPTDSSYVNSSLVGYRLDGNLKWGTLNWIKSGTSDSIPVPLNQLDEGYYSVQMESDTSLYDSSIYDIVFEGEGVKGYFATKRTLRMITYDISPPVLTLDMDKYIKEIFIEYSNSEPLDSAFIVWAPDSLFEHIPLDTMKLVNEELFLQERFKPQYQIDLIDGVIYHPAIYGYDRAGNLSNPGIKRDVVYDITPPIVTIIEPSTGDWINHQSVSILTNEPLQSWAVEVDWQGGSLDERAPYSMQFSDTVQIETVMDLTSFFQWQDGSTYSISIVGQDYAGNISNTVYIDSIHYDVTPPIVTMIYPYDHAAIKDAKVSYSSNEKLLSGEMLWTQTEGTMDTLSPQTVELINYELTPGDKIHISLQNEPKLIDGGIYSVLFTSQDLAGNESDPVIITEVLYDVTPPGFSQIFPNSGDALNHQTISYILSEELEKGAVIWYQTGGKKDSNSPHVVALMDGELDYGRHDSTHLVQMPRLTDGAIYSILFTGEDRAGNIADTVTVTDILYDYTPPEMVIQYPLPRSISKTTAMTYSLSETLHEGEFKWIWLGGVEDTLAPYTAALTQDERQEGDHSEIELAFTPTVVENALYTMIFSGIDRAGNKTLRAFVPGLQYDFTPPTLTWHSPSQGEAVNHKKIHFSNSELLESGTVTWTWTGGVADPDSIHNMALTGQELEGKEFGNKNISQIPSLVDGGIYTISYVGYDPAGNESNHIYIDEILYDITQPEIIIHYPLAKSISRTSAVSYTLSEELHTGQFKWIWLGGVEDTVAPYIAILQDDERTDGDHIEIELSNNPHVVENALYTLTISGEDRAGNNMKRKFIPGLQYDFTPPALTIISPKPDEAINQKLVHFSNSEKLIIAKMVWKQTAGVKDHNSPHILELVDEELFGQEVGPIFVKNTPLLVDGSIYTLQYYGEDPAGNRSDTVTVSNILFDTTPPQFSLTYPRNNIYTTETNIIGEISEILYEFKAKWLGAGPKGEFHPIEFEKPLPLMRGGFNTDSIYTPDLKDGYIYTLTLTGTDRAGNKAIETEISNIKVDLTPPVFHAFYPENNAYINTLNFGWTLSEDIESGIIKYLEKGSEEAIDILLSDYELKGGVREPAGLNHITEIKDGSVFRLTIMGEDYAKNPSESLTINHITYDVSPPNLTIESPNSLEHIQTTDIRCMISEPLISGAIVWLTSTGEEISANLRSEHLFPGEYTFQDYEFNLPENEPLTLTIYGVDRAGNKAFSDTVKQLFYDGTPPVLTLIAPMSNQPVNNHKVSFEFSEDLSEGLIRWESVSGHDPNSPHRLELSAEDLKAGKHSDHTSSVKISLADGVAYNIIIEGTDLAGNVGVPAKAEKLLFDITPPVFTEIIPENDSFINAVNLSYQLSEDLNSGRIIFENTGGNNDSKKSHIVHLVGKRKKSGTGGGEIPASLVRLTNGAKYSIHFEGVDFAGNMNEETTVQNITFDNESPIIAISKPIENKFVNSNLLSYSLSEDLTRGEIILEQTDGVEDLKSPRKYIFSEEEKNTGYYMDKNVGGLGAWVDGAVYSLSISGEDKAGNKSEQTRVNNISYDITPPIVKIDNIKNNSYINYSTVSYTLSENLSEGQISYTPVEGSNGEKSPQVISLNKNELLVGSKAQIELLGKPKLENGKVYTIEISGKDRAGNVAKPHRVEQVTFDNEPPNGTISLPIDSEQIKKTNITYLLSDNLKWGDAVVTQTGGTFDPASPHRVSVLGPNLTKGLHGEIALQLEEKLADGGRYSLTIEGEDKAGNRVIVTPVKNVLFDVLPPRLSFTNPPEGSFINDILIDYYTSEEMGKGELIFTRIGGSEDANSPHKIQLEGEQLQQGDHSKVSLRAVLQDGSIYEIKFTGEDLAGNISDPVLTPNIKYDISPPILVAQSPYPDSFNRSLTFSYSINENLLIGKIILERRGGLPDPGSPRIYTFPQEYLINGEHSDIDLMALLSPKDGVTYTVKIEAEDLAGNASDGIEIQGVTIDNTPPILGITSPNPGSFINTSTIGIRTNENLSSAKIEWVWMEGHQDPIPLHESGLSADFLSDGNYPEVNFDPKPQLISGASYSIRFKGVDRAGNDTLYEHGLIHYDNEPPVLSSFKPKQHSFINTLDVSYQLNEPLMSGKIIWTPRNGTKILVVDMEGVELNPGEFSTGFLTHQKELNEGTVYGVDFIGIDRAGNKTTVLLSDSITYDKSKPKFSGVFPLTSSRINSQLLKWKINEDLKSGKYTWIHMGGKPDPEAPHSFYMSEELLAEGSHDNSSMPDLALVTDAMYRITIEGTDKAGNTGKKFIMSIVYDDIPPTLKIDYPTQKSAVNETHIAYEISETLSEGSFVYEWIGGVPDPNSPVIMPLAGLELETIYESPKEPKNPPMLNDGSVYNIVFNGVDLAKNKSISKQIDSVKYDITRPVLTIYNPQSNQNFMGTEMSIEISEDLKEGKMVWTRTGGVKDRVSRHKIPLYDTYLKEGKHPEAVLPMEKTLSAGVIYSLSVEAHDFAGNEAQPVKIDNIEYIRSMAGRWYYKGAIIEVVWIFEPDQGKNTLTGNFTQGLSLGTKISDKETGRYEFNFNKKPWTLTLTMDNPEQNRISIFEFIDNNHMRVVTGTKKPRDWYDGEVMEYEWRP